MRGLVAKDKEEADEAPRFWVLKAFAHLAEAQEASVRRFPVRKAFAHLARPDEEVEEIDSDSVPYDDDCVELDPAPAMVEVLASPAMVEIDPAPAMVEVPASPAERYVWFPESEEPEETAGCSKCRFSACGCQKCNPKHDARNCTRKRHRRGWDL
jgi:hypothetical protein